MQQEYMYLWIYITYMHDYITTTKTVRFSKIYMLLKKCLEKHQQEPLIPYKASF